MSTNKKIKTEIGIEKRTTLTNGYVDQIFYDNTYQSERGIYDTVEEETTFAIRSLKASQKINAYCSYLLPDLGDSLELSNKNIPEHTKMSLKKAICAIIEDSLEFDSTTFDGRTDQKVSIGSISMESRSTNDKTSKSFDWKIYDGFPENAKLRLAESGWDSFLADMSLYTLNANPSDFVRKDELQDDIMSLTPGEEYSQGLFTQKDFNANMHNKVESITGEYFDTKAVVVTDPELESDIGATTQQEVNIEAKDARHITDVRLDGLEGSSVLRTQLDVRHNGEQNNIGTTPIEIVFDETPISDPSHGWNTIALKDTVDKTILETKAIGGNDVGLYTYNNDTQMFQQLDPETMVMTSEWDIREVGLEEVWEIYSLDGNTTDTIIRMVGTMNGVSTLFLVDVLTGTPTMTYTPTIKTYTGVGCTSDRCWLTDSANISEIELVNNTVIKTVKLPDSAISEGLMGLGGMIVFDRLFIGSATNVIYEIYIKEMDAMSDGDVLLQKAVNRYTTEAGSSNDDVGGTDKLLYANSVNDNKWYDWEQLSRYTIQEVLVGSSITIKTKIAISSNKANTKAVVKGYALDASGTDFDLGTFNHALVLADTPKYVEQNLAPMLVGEAGGDRNATPILVGDIFWGTMESGDSTHKVTVHADNNSYYGIIVEEGAASVTTTDQIINTSEIIGGTATDAFNTIEPKVRHIDLSVDYWGNDALDIGKHLLGTQTYGADAEGPIFIGEGANQIEIGKKARDISIGVGATGDVTIQNVVDPVNDQDAVNKRYVAIHAGAPYYVAEVPDNVGGVTLKVGEGLVGDIELGKDSGAMDVGEGSYWLNIGGDNRSSISIGKNAIGTIGIGKGSRGVTIGENLKYEYNKVEIFNVIDPSTPDMAANKDFVDKRMEAVVGEAQAGDETGVLYLWE